MGGTSNTRNSIYLFCSNVEGAILSCIYAYTMYVHILHKRVRPFIYILTYIYSYRNRMNVEKVTIIRWFGIRGSVCMARRLDYRALRMPRPRLKWNKNRQFIPVIKFSLLINFLFVPNGMQDISHGPANGRICKQPAIWIMPNPFGLGSPSACTVLLASMRIFKWEPVETAQRHRETTEPLPSDRMPRCKKYFV